METRNSHVQTVHDTVTMTSGSRPVQACKCVCRMYYSERTCKSSSEINCERFHIFAGLSERSWKALTQVKNVIEISSDPAYLDNFDQFAIELISVLETTCTFGHSKCQSNVHSSSIAREKLWTDFHFARVTVLVDIWTKFTRSLGLCVDPLVQQYLKQKLYEDIVRSNHTTKPRACK